MSYEDEDFFPDDYNLEEVFDTQIEPLIKAILNICDEYDIPMVAAFQYSSEGERHEMSTTALLPPARASIVLKNIVDTLLVSE